ncbi:MAG TPA: tRNA lysidine(34) synthetase TilS [Steroidobacteraceae bacterium]|nr:tRNA lysidine(34) synthetase TilS [Steroidobacteraceae bacterium]
MRARRASPADASPGPFSSRWLAAQLAALHPGFARAQLCVAFSGGADSTALLAALAARRATRSRLRAVYVDHGLHPDSTQWARHCERTARALGVRFEAHAVHVPRAGSLEAAAREARYALLRTRLRAGELLLTAHHADDQLETLLLQLLRGAGLPGLAAMPAAAAFGPGELLRPLLPVRHAQLLAWVRARGLSFLEDPSNADAAPDRNFLRLHVLPPLLARFPGAAAAVARSARHAAEAQRLLSALARADAVQAADGAALAVPRLRMLPPERRRNLLREWIAASGHVLPDARRLGELATTVLDARADANPEVAWGHSVVRREGGRLFLGRRGRMPPLEPVRWRWRAQQPLVLPQGTLALVAAAHGPIDLARLPAVVRVQGRHGGERLRPRAEGPSRTLKSLLQQARLTPSERAAVPLVFAGTRLLAVGDLWVDAAFQAGPGTRRRGRLVWYGSG